MIKSGEGRAGPVEGAGAATGVSRKFMAGYTIAQVGAFIAFLPLLTILLPLKAESLDPVGRTVLLSQAALCGAIAAALGNLAAGLLSDATSSRFGRRRPWIIAGTLATALACGLIFWAPTPAMLLAAVVFFQLALNAMFGPLNALLPDLVPDRQKGLVSALMGLGLPAASLFTAVVISVVPTHPGTRFLAVAVTILLLILPFALGLREPPTLRRLHLQLYVAAFRRFQPLIRAAPARSAGMIALMFEPLRRRRPGGRCPRARLRGGSRASPSPACR